MNTPARVRVALAAALLAGGAVAAGAAGAAPLGSAITYQGQLQQSGLPADGTCGFEFSLWDAAGSGMPPSGGGQLGGTQTVSPLAVTGGLFTVQLNGANEFGPSAFAGDDRWLQIRVRCPDAGSYTTLGPRQKLTAAPYALYAPSAGSAGDVACSGCVSSGDLANSAVTSTQIAAGTIQASDLAFTPGTVTSITAGSGLTGGTITTSGAIAADVGTTPGTLAAGDHDHYGQLWLSSGGTGLTVINGSSGPGSVGLYGGQGFIADTWNGGTTGGILTPPAGVWGSSINGHGVRGDTIDGSSAGVYGVAYGPLLLVAGPSSPDELVGGTAGGVSAGVGVHGVGEVSTGVWGESTSGLGVSGNSTSGIGVLGTSDTGPGLLASNSGSARFNAALRADNRNAAGGMAAYITNGSNFATAHFANDNAGEVLYLQNGGSDAAGTGGGDFIRCVNNLEDDAQFRVLSNGAAQSDVGFSTPAADFAEMLPGEGSEPGDVLIAGPDGRLVRSNAPRQTSVVGVHSTRPGFVGGRPMGGDAPDAVPLALVGVVPVKASAENGPIRPGDLLVASSTPGHAMASGPRAEAGTVIGKALARLENGTGVIRMVVTLQ